jgi:hypothetical protein
MRQIGRALSTFLVGVMVIGIGGPAPFAGAQAFKNSFTDPPPTGWTGPVFKLSQNYPKTLPRLEPLSKRRWRQFDFRKPVEAPKYLQAVLDYCLEGNTANNFADISQNAVRKWYHAPWLDTTPRGREFIHGMTDERPSRPLELGPAQTHAHDNWAVGFYNARGGYTIGQVWKNPTQPDPRKAIFPSNTVTCKLLFTTAPVAEVPFLDGSLEWEGDINHASGIGPRPTLRLLQLDVAVKDSRANTTTGWVFGTFQYEKAASTSTDWWKHMVPVGLMWGSDVVHLKADQPTEQDWINTARGQKLHLGRHDLVLNGPIDNPLGSCTACHGFAQVARVNTPNPTIPANPPKDVGPTPASMDAYFTNIKAATALSADYVSLDYSLQLQLGIARALKGGATLPPDLNAVRHAAGHPRPPATHIEETTRDPENH